jgi:arsenite-transporting ATPase
MTSDSFLYDRRLRLLLFGGKGGVGKTTAAAATALYRADSEPERRILLVSTDPAHSLSDSFDQPIGDRITPIAARPNLLAMEMDAARQLAAFRERHGATLATIADRGTFFDDDDIAAFLDLSLPGLDELMAIIEVADITRSQRYDLVILDTAPTGHTPYVCWPCPPCSRLAACAGPDVGQASLHRLRPGPLPSRRNRRIYLRDVHAHGKSARPFPCPRRSRDSCRCDPGGHEHRETAHLPTSLRELGLRASRHVIVNRVERPRDCPFCLLRRQVQESHLAEIEARFSTWQPLYAPRLPHYIHGPAALRDYVHSLEEPEGELRQGSWPERPFPLPRLRQRRRHPRACRPVVRA